MHRFVLACVVFFGAVPAAFAQSLNVSTASVVPGAAVVATVRGTAGQNFAVVGSIVNQGFTHAGVALNVGPDVTVLGIGVLDGTGTGTVTVTPPFPARDRYFIQAVVSATPGFVSITPTNYVGLFSTDVTKFLASVGGIVNPNGTTQSLSAGVTVTRTAVGTYRIDYPNAFGTTSIPTFQPVGNRVMQNLNFSSVSATVVFDADCVFTFTVTPVAR